VHALRKYETLCVVVDVHEALAGSWPAEDGGPTRRQSVSGSALGGAIRQRQPLGVTSREVFGANMLVIDAAGRCFLQGNSLGGPNTIGWVEQIDPITLETLLRSPDLPGGQYWAGGLLAHANGALIVTYSQWCHRLDPVTLEICAARHLPRPRPYNSLVAFPSGHVAMKDFDADGAIPASISVLDPCDLSSVCAEVTLPEASIARLSADVNTLYVVGTHSVFRLLWNPAALTLELDLDWSPRYRTLEGQTYGWDPVIVAGSLWFLDNGEGTERFAGTFRGRGTATAPLHLVRVPLDGAVVTLTEICGLPGGLIANPPIADESRQIVVGYDSGNGVVAGFRFEQDPSVALSLMWRRDFDHGAHMLMWPDDGVVMVGDHRDGIDHAVFLDIETGEELARAETASPLQSVLFPAAGMHADVYLCSHTTLSRVSRIAGIDASHRTTTATATIADTPSPGGHDDTHLG